MKALEKVRERRYASVAELAADIQRYIEHRPVLASPPSGLYRARKFLRRHRPAVFGTAAGLAFILLSGVTVWSLMHRGSPPRPRLTDKDTIVLGGFRECHWRSRLRWNAAPDPGGAIGKFTRSGSAFRRAREPDAPPDGPTSGCEAHPGCCVPKSASGQEAQRSWRARSQGSKASTCWVCARGIAEPETFWIEEQAPAAKKEDVFKALGQMVNRFQDPGRRIASKRGKGAQSAGRGNHALTGGLEVLQRGNEGIPTQGTVSGSHLTPEAGHRDRPEICDGLCLPGPELCRSRRVRTWSAEYSQGL